MAITDIIDTLGTPSHFYGISENNYYLDYFISRDDRRNGITVYIDPANDSITWQLNFPIINKNHKNGLPLYAEVRFFSLKIVLTNNKTASPLYGGEAA